MTVLALIQSNDIFNRAGGNRGSALNVCTFIFIYPPGRTGSLLNF